MKKKVKYYLRKFRLEAKMSKAELAKELKIDRSFYILLETNRRQGTIDIWKRIQKVLKIHDADMWKVMTVTKTIEEV